ncbi:MAG: kynureninase, partial [Algoriphagus sp.]
MKEIFESLNFHCQPSNIEILTYQLYNLEIMNYEYSEAFAQKMDQEDSLRSYRGHFLFPKINGVEAIYFCGNSLGLQPKSVTNYLTKELGNWGEMAVDGHFDGEDAWLYVREKSKPALAEILGAQTHEVVAMNNLTVNLHLLMVSFYRPTKDRYKIIIEAGAFPSDQYMLESQVKWHGLNPEEVIVELKPRKGEHTLRTEDILAEIQRQGDSLAMVNMAGLQYYTGQLFDMKAITTAAHGVGAVVGFDLAHAAGNA